MTAAKEEDVEAIRQELNWIYRTETQPKKKTGAFFNFIVPAGVAVTTGVLFTGLHYLIKRDSRKQQIMMRLRVLSQGITAALAAIGVLYFRTDAGDFSESPGEK